MSNVYKNPYIKKEKPTYTVPEYTPDNYFAQMDWNKEIANNKQGYMSVDIMSMKDFYDAGGYSFIDDYRAELADIDAAYDRALPGYGVKGEQMAKAGLTGTGYSDYLGGQAYAGRVAGQALARQNAMANSNSFRAAYNQYVTQQKEKRAANLQTVVDRAISVNMNPNNFVTIATRLGIPQADAERGLEQLIAYYQGIGMDGSGTISGTNTNTENSYTGLNTTQAQEAKEMKSALQAALKGYVNPETGEEVAPTAATIDAALAKYYGSTYSKDDPRVQAAIKEFQFDELTQVESLAKTGQFTTAKTQLDALVTAGVVDENSEQYKTTLAKVQDETGKTIINAIQDGRIESYATILQQAGYSADEITVDNAEELLNDAIKTFAKNGALNYETERAINKEEFARDFKEIENEKQFVSLILQADQEEFNSGEIAEMLGRAEIYTKNKVGRPHVVIKLSNEEEISFLLGDAYTRYSEKDKENIKALEKMTTREDLNLAYVNGQFYRKHLGAWKPTEVVISGATTKNAAHVLNMVVASMLPDTRKFQAASAKETIGLGNEINE